jgi:hypothetical protein
MDKTNFKCKIEENSGFTGNSRRIRVTRNHQKGRKERERNERIERRGKKRKKEGIRFNILSLFLFLLTDRRFFVRCCCA